MSRMARPLSSAPPAAPAPARLVAAVQRRLARGAAEGSLRIERIGVEAEAGEPLAWLAAQPHALKVYWRGRGEDAALAGVGAADRAEGAPDAVLNTVQERLETADESVRYLGGLRFDAAQPAAPEWRSFAAARFVLPRVELRVAGGRATLAAHLVLPRDARQPEAVLAAVRAVQPAVPLRTDALPSPSARTDVPDAAGWRRGVESALRALAETSLEKVVLARRADLDFDAALDPFALAHRLGEATPSCFHFLIQPAPGVAFVGASPERLFRREGDRLWSEAVAGTRPRGASAAADVTLRDELMQSDKEQREHGVVRDYLRGVLGPFCDALALDGEASEMKLARGRHLYSGLRATLRPGIGTPELLRALHPTPAVSGTPTEAALGLIRAREPFDRGWYAGPLGWTGPGAAELTVGIRSGLVQNAAGEGGGARLSLYAGAGIVRGSDPAAEWAETEHKLAPFLHLFEPAADPRLRGEAGG